MPRRLYASEKAEAKEEPEGEKKGFFGRMKAAVGNTFKDAQFRQFLKAFEKEMSFEGKDNGSPSLPD